MAGEDWLAALVGSLQGGVEGLQFMQRSKQDAAQRKALAERQRIQDALAAEDREERRADRDELRRGRERTSVSSMLEEIGRGGRLAPEQAAGARDVGLGHRLEETPDFQNSYFAQAGPVPMMVPDVATTVAPTAAERLADQETARERQRRAQIAAGIADPYERQAFEADPTKYKPSRESFVPLPIRQREAAAAEDAKIGAEVRKGEALLPIKLREKEEGERISAKYRPPSARERGPTDYQTFGMIDKLNARFNTNTKATREVARQYQVMQSSWQALEKGNAGKGIAEQGIISPFNKILDPDSVVREGEYDRTAQGQALLQRMQTIKDNLTNGGQISREVLRDMVNLAGTYAKRAEAFNAAEKTRVGSVADRMGIDQSLIFTAEPVSDGAANTPPSVGAGSGPAVGTLRTINGQRARWDGKGWLPVQ
jgi:hypothetical protein